MDAEKRDDIWLGTLEECHKRHTTQLRRQADAMWAIAELLQLYVESKGVQLPMALRMSCQARTSIRDGDFGQGDERDQT